VKFRERLQRLEKLAQGNRQVVQAPAPWWETGGEPMIDPCPPWLDPEDWACRIRVGDCLLARGRGELPADQYLPGMAEADRRYADDLTEVWQIFLRFSTAAGQATGSPTLAHGASESEVGP
jgi:hypothetical protein